MRASGSVPTPDGCTAQVRAIPLECGEIA